jgi:aldehyde dehydrogenase (NAD+)
VISASSEEPIGSVPDGANGLASSLQVGDAMEPGTQIGPMVSARQRDRVEG